MNRNEQRNQKTIWNRLGIKAIAGLLVLAMFATAMPVQAAQDLKITDNNLNILRNNAQWTAYGSGYLMTWPSSLDVKYQKSITVGTITGVTVADNNNGYWGQCVSLVKALSKNNVATGSWIKGRNVLSSYNVAPGTAIATFDSGGHYSGHVAVFQGYFVVQGIPIGIRVWDQNYVAGSAVGKHNIMDSGSGVSDADNYYVVQVP